MEDQDLGELVVACIERVELEGPAALDAFCSEHPEHAVELRRAIELLVDCGVVEGPPDRPRSIGDFTIVRELGSGGMGVVYEASQRSLDRTVALKVLRPHLQLDASAVERFRREAMTASGLRHRGIAQIYATGIWDELHYLAMELVDGASLDRVLGVLRNHTVSSLNGDSIRQALRQVSGGDVTGPDVRARSRGYFGAVAGLVAEVADALECAHSHGVIHRDIKPSNVMLRRDGSAVLSDFGLARRQDLPSMTRSGAFAGTPFYTSPEQAAGRKDLDHRTDVFSLGATLYELLTLRLPFWGDSSAEVLHAIQHREPTDPRKHVRGLPTDLAAIAQRALEKRPGRRYASAAELAEDLRAFLEHRPVSAQPIGPGGRIRRWAQRQPLQATLAATLAVGIPLVTGLTANIYANREKVAAAERMSRTKRVQAALLDGFIAVGERRWDDAARDMRIASSLDPAEPEAWAGEALAAIELGTDAMRDWTRRLDAHGRSVREDRAVRRAVAYVRQALGEAAAADRTLANLGGPTEPLESFWVGMRAMEVAMRELDRNAADEAYRHLLDAVIGSRSARPAYLYWLAVAAGEVRDAAGARRVARTMQRLWPDAAATWIGSGLALHYVDPEQAVRAYRRALEISPGAANVRNNLGNVLSDLGDVDAALAQWRRVVAESPRYAPVRANLGRALFYRGELEEAVEQLRTGAELDPTELLSQHYLIWSLRELGRRRESIDAARRAITALPDVPLLRRDLANALADSGDLDAAMTAARQALELDESAPASLRLLGDLHNRRGEREPAIAMYRARVDVAADPKARSRAREDLCVFLVRDLTQPTDEDRAEALEIAERLADETGGQDPWILEILAHAQFTNGQLEEAIGTATDAIASIEESTEPDVERLRSSLVEIRDRARRRQDAR